MAILYDTQPQLDSLLASGGIDLSVRNSIINYLMIDGLLTSPGDRVAVQDENLPPPIFPPLDSSAQVLFLTSPVGNVATDANLKVIVETGDAFLTVTGGDDVFVATGKGPDLVDMRGSSGDDVIMVGSGHQTVLAGAGADSVYGGKGADQFIGGTGDRQLLQAGSGPATLIGGSGAFDTLIGGSGNDHHGGNPWGDNSFATLGGGDKDDSQGNNDDLKGSNHGVGKFDSISGGDLMMAGSGDNQWLLAGSDPATVDGGIGSNDTVQGGSGNDLISGGSGLNQLLDGGEGADTITAGTGGDTLRGGLGDDLYKIGPVGNDTVQGGGGNDILQFSNSFKDGSATNATVTTNNGLTTVQFANTGQTIDVSNVKTLVFSDQTVHLH